MSTHKVTCALPPWPPAAPGAANAVAASHPVLNDRFMDAATEQEQTGQARCIVRHGNRPVALVTGVGRTVGIGAGIASQLAASGWDVAFTYWTPYDERMTWG